MRLRLAVNAAGDIRLRLMRDTPDMRPIETPGGAPLVCSSEVPEMTTPARTGPRAGFGGQPRKTSFGKAARQIVREAGGVLDERPAGTVVFLTGTLPGSTDEAMAAIARWSGWITKTLAQWCRDFAHGAQFFGVWEWQKRGALHLHLCVATESAADARVLMSRWKARWIKTIDGVCKRDQTDLFATKDGGTWQASKWITRTDAQVVEKSVGRYLSKYLSKGSVKDRRTAKYFPSRWWMMSAELRQTVAARRVQVEVKRLSLAAALDLFERVGAAVADASKTAFACFSAFDSQFKGLTGLSLPAVAGALFRQVAPEITLLEPIGRPLRTRNHLEMTDVAYLFGGRVLPVTNTC